MRFSTTVGALRSALTTAGHATPTSVASITAYSGVLLSVKGQVLSVKGSDGLTTITASMDIKNGQDGSALLPPAPLRSYLGTLYADRIITVVHPENGDVEVSLSGANPYRFRPIVSTFSSPAFPRVKAVPVNLEGFAEALAPVRTTVAKNSDAVQVVSSDKGLYLHSTDQFRLTRAHLPTAGFGNFSGVLPLSVLERVAQSHITEVSVDPRGSSFKFEGPNVSITCQLVEVIFPSFDSILEHLPTSSAVLPVEETLQALASLRAVAAESHVEVSLDQDSLILSVNNASIGAGTENISLATPATSPVKFLVQLGFFYETVASHKGSSVTLYWTSPQEALYLHSAVPTSLYSVVMPVVQ